MPNNCSSIFNNKFYLILLCGSLFSCASSNPSSNLYNDFSGKILLKSLQNQQISYNSNIIIYENRSIIQITKPFIGNVINIKLHRDKPIEVNPIKNAQNLKKLIELHEKDVHDWLYDCVINKNRISIYKKDFSFFCSEENGKSNIKINNNFYEITVILLKKDR